MRYHVNGALVDADDATIGVLDRGFLYGDAAFETLRAYGGTVFEWEAHRERLGRTCEALGMPDAVPDDLRGRVHETLEANDLPDAYVRVSVTRGEQPGKLTPLPEVEPGVVVIVKPLPRGGLDGEPVWDGPAALRTVETRRVPEAAIPAGVKTHNYLSGILARLELRGTDADEALVRDLEGYLAEGATSNVFLVGDDGLATPGLEGPVLPGVTRSVVLDLARGEGLPVETGRYTVEDVKAAREVFVTNTTWEVRPVDRVDGVEIGGGPVTDLLARLFEERVERYY